MHATIQKPIDEILRHIQPKEKVFVVGCNNCAWKCHSGGEDQTKMMAKRLSDRGVDVVGYTVPGPIKGAIHRDKSIEPGCAIEALSLQQHVHAVNVTDNQSALLSCAWDPLPPVSGSKRQALNRCTSSHAGISK